MTVSELIKTLNSIKKRFGCDTEIIVDMIDHRINEFVPLVLTEDKPEMSYAEGFMDEGNWVAKLRAEIFEGCPF